MSDIYKRRMAENRCGGCGKQDERTLSGKTMCAECTAKRAKKYNKRWEQHLCTKCGRQDERTLSGKTMCAECAAKNIMSHKPQKRKASTDGYWWMKERHRCTKCGQRDARTLSGFSMCAVCAAKSRRSKQAKKAANPDKITPEQAAIRNAAKRELCQKRKEAGICITCGKHKADGGSTRCIYCTIKHRECSRASAAKSHLGRQGNMLSRSDWKDLGLCLRCGNLRDGQLNKDGTPSKVCSRCYKNSLPGERR